MENSTLSSYVAQFPSYDWTDQCIQRLVAAGNQSIGYVGDGGSPQPSFIPNATWGIDRETCIKFCNSSTISSVQMPNNALWDLGD